MRSRDLTVAVLQDIRICALQHSWQAATEARCMLSKFVSASSCLYTDELYFLIANKLVEHSNRIRSPAHTRNQRCRQFAFGFQDLLPRFASDHGMEVAHHSRIRMRAQHAPQQIMRGADVSDP